MSPRGRIPAFPMSPLRMASDRTRSPQAPPADRRRLSGIAALVGLMVISVAPPAALITIIGNPIPDQALLGDQITDDAVIGILAGVVWLAWAQLMLAIVVEGFATFRSGAIPRRLPWSGPQQHLARHLVITAGVLLAGTATATGSYAGTDATAAVIQSAAPCAPDSTGPIATSDSSTDAPSVTPSVTPSVAVPGTTRGPRPLATDTGITSSARAIIGPGGTAATKQTVTEAGRWYIVKPPQGRHHDTLWDIAERHLGDGRRWKQIYDLNRNRPQPDGRRLENAHLIHPGWRLLLPADATGVPADNGAVAETPTDSRAPDDALEVTSPTPHTPTAPSLIPPARTKPSPATSPTSAPAAPAAESVPAAEVEPAAGTVTVPTERGAANRGSGAEAVAVPDSDSEDSVPYGALALGLTAIAAAGVLGEFARRRRRAQRFRVPGTRLRRTTSSQAHTLARLRTANAEITLDLLRRALRQLADACYRDGRELPVLDYVTLNATSLSLHLATDEATACGPFTARTPRTWDLRPDDVEGDSAGTSSADTEMADDGDPIDPYPVLVSIGVTDDAVVLVNLESAGTLWIDGPLDEAREIAHALAVEAGTQVVSIASEVALVECPPAFAHVTDAGRVRAFAPDAARRWAAARRACLAEALHASDLNDVAQARSRRVAGDLWVPAVLINAAAPTHAPEPSAATARCGVSIIQLGTPPAEAPGWRLHKHAGVWRLDPAGIELSPQCLSPDVVTDLEDLLESADQFDPAAAAIDALPGDSSLWGPCDLGLIAAALPDPGPRSGLRTDAPADARVAPRVRVLGPVEVTGLLEEAAPSRPRRVIELIAYLALHPDATQHQVDDALWPGVRVSRNTRNPLVSRARQWLGSTADGELHLPTVAERGTYALHPGVSCDWHEFCEHARRGLAAGPDGTEDLIAALNLVRGRPFLGVNPAAYAWAEADAQDMISAIVDVANALAGLALERGDYRRARWAAAKGLSVDPVAESLVQAGIRAARAADDRDDVDRLVGSLRRHIEQLDPDDDMDPVTGWLAADPGR